MKGWVLVLLAQYKYVSAFLPGKPYFYEVIWIILYKPIRFVSTILYESSNLP